MLILSELWPKNDVFVQIAKKPSFYGQCDGQVSDKQISVPVISTIVAMFLGTNTGVAFTAVDERLAAIRIKAKYFYISLICAHVKVGREGIFGPIVGKHSLHEKTSDNGFRLVSFAATQNMVIYSTRRLHRNIHKTTIP